MAHSYSNAKIIGIQFSILSPDEIRKGSVAEINSRDTYINNKPVINGLFDPRMGVLEPGLICPTDGLNYIHTPGYFGHLELTRPVFYIQYLTTVIKILRCVCFKCSKLLISKDKYFNLISSMPNEARWNYLFSIASKVKRCGEDTEDGCGCKQPKRIKKEGLATIYAEWDSLEGVEDDTNLTIKLTVEMVLKILSRISDDDISFMGFSPIFSRPEWMICQVLAIPPPAVRPSIKHDSQQRSEDDISHILVNIIKANKTLAEKIASNANENVINDWHTVLQYYVATQIDNKIPGVAAVAQRSGRPLKSIKERLNGKIGRVRGNLMGKRVDYSARSVITPDPNVSINELGVPLKIAMNITKPVIVNKSNTSFLMKLVLNGPDTYPGAKVLERANGEHISLRYIDRNSIKLNNNDIVHRHMMNGDSILFNRQPTLHRMSMMCHKVKVMSQGNTFRMNVADTKPYNADFDGDEMNLHMPQDVEAEIELSSLAAVTHQLVSPANNQPIVGIFQDSQVGAYLFSRPNIKFSPRTAMNLLINYNKINMEAIDIRKPVTSFEILTQILPPITLKQKNKQYDEDIDDYKTTNNILEIKNGDISRGYLDKGALGKSTKGILHRIINDYGNVAACDFIDNFQTIITDYMKQSAYSVGISDLMANTATNDAIIEQITKNKKEVIDLIQETHLSVFKNKTGKTNKDEFEGQVNTILNTAAGQAGKLGRKNLDKKNRFVIMVNAGSKGSDLNISQMISCLGQQNVDGKRIPYGFDDRTLPHFKKFDDSPEARGFVQNSFIGGLTPEELFFHAMGGRVGLIDTAVKTSQTGYIQRRLIKGMEDYMICYDMTVRNHKNQIIQFKYGGDGFDTIKIENQDINLPHMSLDEIYEYYNFENLGNVIKSTFTSDALSRYNEQLPALKQKNKTYINKLISWRDHLIKKVFNYTTNTDIHLPIAFKLLIENVKNQQNIQSNSLINITPLEVYEIIENVYNDLELSKYSKPPLLFKIMYYYYLSPKQLLMISRLNKDAVVILMKMIVLQYKKALVNPGEMVGMIAAQSIGEPTTQMTLNTFHFAGVASKSNVTRGVPRVEEILSLTENIKNPSVTIFLKNLDKFSRKRAQTIMNNIEYTILYNLIESCEICYDPSDSATLISDDKTLISQYLEYEKLFDECSDNSASSEEYTKWILRIKLNKEQLLEKNITMDDINFAIKNCYQNSVSCVYSDYNDENLIFRIRITNILQNKKQIKLFPLDQSDEIYLLKNFQDQLLNKCVIRGISGIEKVTLRKIPQYMIQEDSKYIAKEIWVLDTVGTNLLEILALDYIDANKTISNSIMEVYNVLGIEAARQSIYNEAVEVFEDNGYINSHHLELLADRMTYNTYPISMFRHGINNDNIGPLAKASFEETPEMFLKAARHAELDTMRGVSANVMCGQEGNFGTGAFNVFLDIEKMKTLQAVAIKETNIEKDIEMAFGKIENPENPCNTNNLTIINNAINIEKEEFGQLDDSYSIDI